MKRKGVDEGVLWTLIKVILALAGFALLVRTVIFVWNNGIFDLIGFLISTFITGMNPLPVPDIFPTP